MTHIRPYQSDDLDALYEICLGTGAAGSDATDLIEDPRLFGEVYAAPYGTLEPEHAFVLDNGAGGAIGYVLGALDTAGFEARCEATWWPELRERHRLQPHGKRLDDLLIYLLHHRSLPSPEVLQEYPSHLHIDLLPVGQSSGWGRRLLETLFHALRADGSPGVHWGVSTQNEHALGFYRHLGFPELSADPSIVTFAVRL